MFLAYFQKGKRKERKKKEKKKKECKWSIWQMELTYFHHQEMMSLLQWNETIFNKILLGVEVNIILTNVSSLVQ